MRGLALSGLVLSAAALSPLMRPINDADHKIQHLDASGEFTYLGDLEPTMKSVGWGSFWVNRNWYTNGFKIAGHTYDNGVFAHAPSDVRYHIGGKYAFFSGCVGLDDGNVGGAHGETCGDGVDFKIFLDGAQKFMHHASGGMPAKCFRLDVKNVKNLQLVADHRTDQNCDESAWVNTKLYEDPIIDCMELGDLTPSYKSVGYMNYFVNKNWYMQGFLINGVQYGSGVFAHANSKLVYPLHGKYHTFHGCAGIDDGNKDCGDGAHFEVLSDGLSRWKRQVVKNQAAQCFSVSIADAFALELTTSKTEAVDACDHTEWVNADLCITNSPNEKVDCEVGDWEVNPESGKDWSTCSKQCNTGYQYRQRKITRHPEHGGKHCPPIHQVTACNAQPCPIDCQVGPWEASTSCTVTCTATYINNHNMTGGDPAAAGPGKIVSGYQSRFRSIVRAAAYGGKACPPLQEKMACNTQRCPVDCKTSDYGVKWSACSKSCNGGIQTRTLRVIQQPAYNGKTCPPLTETRSCNEQDCVVDATCGAWSQWSSCSKDCNTGYKKRTREELTPASYGGVTCGTTEQIVACNTQACPIDCVLDTHAPWDDVAHPCSRPCGTGTKTRGTSVKIPAAYGGKPCTSLTETVTCNTQPCPVDCTYTLWGTWSQCDKSCTSSDGSSGKKMRKRSVIAGAQHGGKACPHLDEEKLCSKHACPIDCAMSDFGKWGECSLKCGGGVQTRSKTILRQGEYGGHECPGTDQVQPCNEQPCAIDCELGEWGPYKGPDGTIDKCSAECGGGWMTRTREVVRKARYGGKPCGAESMTIGCNTNKCPIPCKYTPWAPEHIEFAPCDRTCGGGRRTQTRSITQAADYGAPPCGATQYVGSCNELPCPVDCVVSEWSVWSDCSKSCGFGHQQRTRNEVRKGQNGGKSCSATSLFEERRCNAGPCSAECEVSPWSEWGDCISAGKVVTCGTGVQKRTREIKKHPDVRFDASTRDITSCPFLEERRACSQVPCEQDCILNDWFDWSPCTMSCGTGWQRRHTTIKQLNVGAGKKCGSLVQVRECNTKPCPIHCLMTPFTAWGPCSDACGTGTKMRTRSSLREGDFGGKTCPHTSETRSCNNQPCPQDCVIDNTWTEGTCTAECGGGIRVDTKSVHTPAAYGGAACGPTSRTVACNQKHCPLDCKLTPWSPWSKCTKTCGGAGTQTKTRMIDVHPRWGGQTCEELGGVIDTQECNMGPCPVHCTVSEWTEWTPCSKTCGTGSRTRERTVTQFSDFGGYQCPELSQTESCGTDACPIDCDVTAWGSWSTCSKSCGGGEQERHRDISQEAQHGGKNCPHRDESRKCNSDMCPVDCQYTAWGWLGEDGAWSVCSRSCGGGVRQQRRQVTRAMSYGGKPCPSRVKVEKCPDDKPCPLDCQWGAFSWWSPCSKSCGTTGTRTRSRKIHRNAALGGKACPPTQEIENCNRKECPVDCEMEPWGSWGRCSQHCGPGIQTRTRARKVEAQHGGVECGVTEQKKNCKIMDCPVDCEVSTWTGYDKCNVGCGGGIKRRYRQVTVSPANGGKQCPTLFEEMACATQSCPVHCTVTDFANWSECSRSCGTGIMIRKRAVHQEAQLGGRQCPELSQARSCNTKPCPVDCEVSAYTAFSACSVSCGMGFKFRTRKQTRAPAHGGAKCPPLTETGFCNDMECPVSCVLGEWGGFTACSKTCGAGTRFRTRRILRPAAHGGAKCEDIKAWDDKNKVEFEKARVKETEPCFKETCPIDCVMSEWAGWGPCSADCGNGINTNTRTILQKPGPKGKACPIPDGSTDPTIKTKKCYLGVCAIHCIESAWSAWGPCSKKCGGGIKKRTRSILQERNEKGEQCGSLLDVLECNEQPCPQDCEVTDWPDNGGWSGCSKTCGRGYETRTRSQTKPSLHGGKQCPALTQTRACNTQHCPQDCLVSEWGGFTQCTKSCGGGKMTARRTVLTAQGYGGEPCPASPTGDADFKTKTQSCENQPCPIDCQTTTWSPYSRCSKSCAQVIQEYVAHKGVQMSTSAWHSRSRSVLPEGQAKYGGKGCPHLFEKTVCNSYGECMNQFFSTETPAPTPYTNDMWHAAMKTAKKHVDTTVADNEALKTVRATNSPTAYPTPAPITVPQTCQNCASAGQCETVAHGWHGAGAGSNWCNLCRCNDGMLQCQKRKCGTDGLLQGETCSHTKCQSTTAYTKGIGDSVVSHQVIEVSHDHRENFGSLHHCSYMLNTQKCACHCYGNTFKSIIAAKASIEAALK